jgi:hypothetical protein
MLRDRDTPVVSPTIRSDTMLDSRPTATPVGTHDAGTHQVDEACRGIGRAATAGAAFGELGVRGARGVGRGPSVRGDVQRGDAQVDRPVVRDGDPRAVRHAVASAVTHAVARDAAERAAEPWPRPAAGDAAAPGERSPELDRLLAHLRATVARYVVGRHDAGAPIERVLPEVKGMVREAAACEAWYDADDTLMRQVVGWTIAAYYDGAAAPEPPRGATAG